MLPHLLIPLRRAVRAVNHRTCDRLESVRQVASADFPTRWGKFQISGFERDFEQAGRRRRETALALLLCDLKSSAPLVRIHSQCLTGDALGSLRCDCGQQLQMAMAMISQKGSGLLICEKTVRGMKWGADGGTRNGSGRQEDSRITAPLQDLLRH